MTDSDLLDSQELHRAQAIIEKASRLGEDVGKALRDHMVPQSISRGILGTHYEYTPKKKRLSSEDVVLAWAKAHVGESTNPASIAEATGLSYSVTNKVVGGRRDWFLRIKKGHYVVKDADAEREAEKGMA